VSAEAESDVIVDFVFEDGLLYVVVANVGDRPALQVSFKFGTAFRGLGGSVEMTRLPLLRAIPFLAPRKEIRTLLDSAADYFARGEPTKITVTVSYRAPDGTSRKAAITHDLAIYRDLAYVVPSRAGLGSDTRPA
jgi:hypothetical protein